MTEAPGAVAEHRAVVVGGGIAGLSAAFSLHEAGAQVTVVEAGTELGGKIRTTPFMGRPVDEAADMFLTRVPWGLELAGRLGVADQLISPATSSASVVIDGTLRRLPDGLVLGVPTRFWPLVRSRVVSPVAALRAGLDRFRGDDWHGGDESVGALVRRRLGDQVADRLVGPLIGSIYAGDTDHLDLHLAAPQFEQAARTNHSLINGLRDQVRDAASDGPVESPFNSLPGGMGQLVATLAGRLRRADIRLGATVRAITPDGGPWAVELSDGETLPADSVVVATPAGAAADLLEPLSPGAAGLRDVEYSSVILVTMGLRRDQVGHRLDGSGMLLPAEEGTLATACSWGSSKWPHWADEGQVVLRVSAGRAGDERAQSLDDDTLVDALLAEMAPLLDISGSLSEWRVSRWPDALPQYTPGHANRITRIEAGLAADAPGVVITGAMCRGLGVPACIRQGGEAAQQVLDRVAAH